MSGKRPTDWRMWLGSPDVTFKGSGWAIYVPVDPNFTAPGLEPDPRVDVLCNACRKRLARLTDAIAKVDPTLPVVALVGTKATLEPGFVNAKRHHPSGIRRWLVRGRDPSRPSPSPRLPAVVTCKCGSDNLLTGSRGQVWHAAGRKP